MNSEKDVGPAGAADRQTVGRDKRTRQGTAAKAPRAEAHGGAVTDDPISAKVLNKREFIGRVADSCATSRAQVRPVVEATLQQLGKAIMAGETLSLPPFGKARVSRQRTKKGSEVLVLRLLHPGGTQDEEPDDAD